MNSECFGTCVSGCSILRHIEIKSVKIIYHMARRDNNEIKMVVSGDHHFH